MFTAQAKWYERDVAKLFRLFFCVSVFYHEKSRLDLHKIAGWCMILLGSGVLARPARAAVG